MLFKKKRLSNQLSRAWRTVKKSAPDALSCSTSNLYGLCNGICREKDHLPQPPGRLISVFQQLDSGRMKTTALLKMLV